MMALRSIKLKLYLPGTGSDSKRDDLWTTHVLFNQGVRYYSEQLLALRQMPMRTNISGISTRGLVGSARRAQKANGRPGTGSESEILAVLRALYEAMIPSCIGGDSNSQSLARTFLSPLTDLGSRAGAGAGLGRKPTWQRLRDQGDPGWRKEKRAFARRRARGPAELLVRARDSLGLLPLFPSFSDRLGRWTKRTVNTTWDRAMFQQTIELLLSWERWNQKLMARNKVARLSLPDPVKYPVWTRLGAPGGGLHRYRLSGERGAGFSVELPLLSDDGDKISQSEHVVRLARSAQLSRYKLVDYSEVPPEVLSRTRLLANDVKKQWFELTDRGTGTHLYGRLAGAKLQLDRRKLAALSRSDKDPATFTGQIYLTMALDIIPAVPELDAITRSFVMYKPDGDLPWMVSDFKPAVLSKLVATRPEAGVAGLSAGLRVMSVEPGLDELATCSVFELSGKAPPDKLAFEVEGTRLKAVHDRTFTLRMPGERPSRKVMERRAAVTARRRGIEQALEMERQLLTLADRSTAERQEGLVTLRRSVTEHEDTNRGILSATALDPLQSHLEDGDGSWSERVITVHRDWERVLSKAIAKWRDSTRTRMLDDRGLGGLSTWWIEELTATRKLVNAWSLHGRKPNEKVGVMDGWYNQSDDFSRLVDTERRLHKHINNLKSDRVRKGAHQIIMAALGYVHARNRKAWDPRHPPCRLILFEDPAKSQFHLDRPKCESTALMAWAHKSLLREVTMQGATFGVRTGMVKAGYVSRFHSVTGAPGIRVKEVSRTDLIDKVFAGRTLTELRERGFLSWKEADDLMKLPAAERAERLARFIPLGSLFPYFEGDLFATAGHDGHRVQVNAKVNSAQYLQRRFWARHSEIVRLTCRPVNGQVGVFVPVAFGTRIRRTLGYGLLASTKKKNEHVWKKLSKKKWIAIDGVTTSEEPGEGPPLADAQMATGITTFFRDPSGSLFATDRWIPAAPFWEAVKRRVQAP